MCERESVCVCERENVCVCARARARALVSKNLNTQHKRKSMSRIERELTVYTQASIGV